MDDTEGEVSSGTVANVKINGKEAAVLGSMVKTCNDPQPQETCSIIAVGAPVVLPIMMLGMDLDQFKKDGGTRFNTATPITTMAKTAQSRKQPKLQNPRWSNDTPEIGEEESSTNNIGSKHEIIFKDSYGTPVKRVNYKIISPDGEERSGKTGDDGMINEKGIPVTCHGSPDAMCVADAILYLKEHKNKSMQSPEFKDQLYYHILEEIKESLQFVDSSFVRPNSWRKVLDYIKTIKGHKFRLNLAHFAGYALWKKKEGYAIFYERMRLCKII